jgi:hypothetical protein
MYQTTSLYGVTVRKTAIVILTTMFVFGATTPSGPGPPHLRGF